MSINRTLQHKIRLNKRLHAEICSVKKYGALIILLSSFFSFGQLEEEKSEMNAFRMNAQIKVDGVLDEDVWASSEVAAFRSFREFKYSPSSGILAQSDGFRMDFVYDKFP